MFIPPSPADWTSIVRAGLSRGRCLSSRAPRCVSVSRSPASHSIRAHPNLSLDLQHFSKGLSPDARTFEVLGVGLQHKDLEGHSSVHTWGDVPVGGRAEGPGPGQSMTLALEEGVALGRSLDCAPTCLLHTPGSGGPPALNTGRPRWRQC